MDFYHCEMCNIQRLYIVDSPDIFCCKSLFTAGWSKKWHGTQKFSVFHFRIHINLINYIGYDKWAPTNCTKTLFVCPNNGEKACLSDEHLGNKIYWRFRAQNQTKIFINQPESATNRNNVQTKTNIFITHGKLMFAQRPLI